MGVVLYMLSSIVVDRWHFVATFNQNQDAKEKCKKERKNMNLNTIYTNFR